MGISTKLLTFITGFLVIAISSNLIAEYFRKYKLPLITGFLIMGIVCGPYFLGFIPIEAVTSLNFINDIALAVIAFVASSELYLKDLRGQMRSIKWMTFGQLVVTFISSAIVIYFLADIIPFMNEMNGASKLAVALLMATIFVARSPATAMAVINEMRAKGPFTQMVIGVTVLKDFLVIILFAICINVAIPLVSGAEFGLNFLITLLLELVLSVILGFVVGRIIYYILYFRILNKIKAFYIMAVGYGVYSLSHLVSELALEHFNTTFHLEPLLACIIGSFWVSNYTRFRYEFIKILEDISPYVYIAFFTLAGAALSIELLYEVGLIALLLFIIRLASIAIGAYVGSTLAGDPPLRRYISWMPFVTNAGVALGLATVVENTFPGWGASFATLVVAVIVINQLIGPILFKWSLVRVGENHDKADAQKADNIKDAIIFGLESQSIALAKELNHHGWLTKIVTVQKDIDESQYEGFDIVQVDKITKETLEEIDAFRSEGIVLLFSDDENYRICELIYENIGTENVVVRINNLYNMKKFHDLGAIVVNPGTAMVGLLDHMVRSPQATSLLLGMQKEQDTLDVEVQNPNLVGLPLRDLRLPSDIIILSVRRKGQTIISHGYTRLRKGDWVTMVGSNESLRKMNLMFGR